MEEPQGRCPGERKQDLHDQDAREMPGRQMMVLSNIPVVEISDPGAGSVRNFRCMSDGRKLQGGETFTLHFKKN